MQDIYLAFRKVKSCIVAVMAGVCGCLHVSVYLHAWLPTCEFGSRGILRSCHRSCTFYIHVEVGGWVGVGHVYACKWV